MIYYVLSYELWIYLKMFFHNNEIYLLSLIFFSLKRRWKSLSSSISPSDNIWSTRLSNLSSRATGEDEWGNKINRCWKHVYSDNLQWLVVTIHFVVQPEDARVLEPQGTPKTISSILPSLLLQEPTVWNSSIHIHLQTPVNQSTDHILIVKIPYDFR